MPDSQSFSTAWSSGSSMKLASEPASSEKFATRMSYVALFS